MVLGLSSVDDGTGMTVPCSESLSPGSPGTVLLTAGPHHHWQGIQMEASSGLWAVWLLSALQGWAELGMVMTLEERAIVT